MRHHDERSAEVGRHLFKESLQRRDASGGTADRHRRELWMLRRAIIGRRFARAAPFRGHCEFPDEGGRRRSETKVPRTRLAMQQRTARVMEKIELFAVGGSAGGLEALSKIAARLPREF